jgi:hypothetical protein
MKIIKILFYILVLLLHIAVFLVGLFFVPAHTAWWLCNTLVLFIIIMRKCRRLIKYLSIPIALVCCIVAYYHGSVRGEIDWGCGAVFYASLGDYTLYRYSTYIKDCAQYTIKYWLLTILIVKLYDFIKYLVNNESFRQKIRHLFGRG